MNLCSDHNFNLYGNRSEPLFPAFFWPKTSELFSSWIVRLAHAHFMKAHTFTTFNFPAYQFWNRDIDRSADNKLLHLLALKTNSSFDRIYQTTLKSYEGILFEEHTEKTTTKWLMPLGIYHRTWKNKGLMFCPGCLLKDKNEPYYRKHWRLSLSVVCLECDCFLLDSCPSCDAPITFFRAELGQKFKEQVDSIAKCYRCSYNLSKNKLFQADAEIKLIQSDIEKIMKFGWKEDVIYPLQFFEVLNYILKIFTGNRKIYLQAQRLLSDKLQIPALRHSNDRTGRFDALTVFQRCTALKMAFWTLENWPVQFIDFFKSAGFYSSDLIRDFYNVPFWYFSVVYENFHVSNVNRRF